MKKITILSGKGGVGKSSITASLAVMLARDNKIVAVDCDVDASNLPLLFGIKEFEEKEKISTNYKAFTNEKAKNCKKILDVCAFSAISWNEEEKMPEINKLLCEGCGACQLLCPEGIELKKVKNATIGKAQTKYGFPVFSGQLEIGESGSGNVVEVVKEKAEKSGENENIDYMIADSSAGIGCPVIASVRGSDFVIGVTEPTPSGLNDLKRAFNLVNHFDIPHGTVINKYDLNEEMTKKITNYARKNEIPILGKIPYDKKFVESMVNLLPIVVYDKKYEKLFLNLLKKIRA